MSPTNCLEEWRYIGVAHKATVKDVYLAHFN